MDWSELEQATGYRFKDEQLLLQSVTHPSFANEQLEDQVPDNQRLEFLGDAVLGLVIARSLYERYPSLPEGRLSRLKAALVCEATLAEVAADLGIASVLRLGRGELATGGSEKPSILSDAVEAVLGAIYLDGGYAAALSVIEHLFETRFDDAYEGRLVVDYKTALQEYVQAFGRPPPEYEVTDCHGPAHEQRFTVTVSIDGEDIASGSGPSKKVAQKEAAAQALHVLSNEHPQPQTPQEGGDNPGPTAA